MTKAPSIAVRCANTLCTLAHAAVDFVYPPACPFCGRGPEGAERLPAFDPAFCLPCRDQIAPKVDHWCLRCGAPVGPHLETSSGCGHCHADRFNFETVLSLGVYADSLKTACIRAKQPGGRPLAAALAGLLWERRQDALRQAGVDVVVAVPRHWTRRLGQGHNAADTLAESLARRLQVEFGRHILGKVRRTPAQSTLPPYRRRSNLRRAFRVRGKRLLAGASVLLVDDILTTGTTANEISRALRSGGAARIVVAVPARGIGQ